MALVSGYDSESESDSESLATKPVGLSAILPTPSSSSLSGGLKLPAPSKAPSSATIKTNQKRKPEKRQIKIDSLDALQGEDDEATVKRAKLDVGTGGSKAGLHGLLGMLPAPKQTGPPPANDKGAEEAPANKMGIASGSEGKLQLDAAGLETKKTKGNNDFRAMLGLKSSNLPQRVKIVSKETPSNPSLPDISSSNEPLRVKEEKLLSPPAAEKSNNDFFSLGEQSSSASLTASKPSFTVSTAPEIEGEKEEEERQALERAALEEEEQYKGWQQGPDGNWFPVTPEAHAAYSQFLASQRNAGGQEMGNRPADMQYSDTNAIQSVDANASRQAWLSRPSSEVNAGSADLDRKYALAAASMAMPDQGVPLVDQEEEVRKMDKKTNMRAKRKGQLTSLIAQAEESREKLEERWSKGKDGRNTAKAKYGF